MRRSRPSTLRNVFILLVVLFAANEALFFLAGGLLASKGVFYRPATSGTYDDYMARRDPVLGWPLPDGIGKYEYDEIGSRLVPAFPNSSAKAAVSLYGDSFTWGSLVPPEYAWGNVLAKMIGRRVNNFGVQGYGSDQAFLRFRENESDRAQVVILGHLGENIVRNVNQFRNLLGSDTGAVLLKPRFVVENEKLRLIDLPKPSRSEYELCAARPEQYLEYEGLLPGSPGGPLRFTFPFTLSALRALLHPRITARLKGEPWYLDFYRADHPANGVSVTAAVLSAFVDVARSRGKTPLVLLIPTGHDLTMRREQGSWSYAPLTARLAEARLPVLDAGPPLLAQLAGRPIGEIFAGADTGNHFNVEGNFLLARIVGRRLEEDRTAADHGHSEQTRSYTSRQ